MKLLFSILLALFALSGLAQKHNIYYLKYNGRELTSADSADYVRIINEPDAGSDLYGVIEYYPNKTRKLIGRSSEIDPVRYQGPVLTFYKTGKRESVTSYVNGLAVDTAYTYYPNGRLYIVKHFEEADTSKKPDFVNDANRQLIDAEYDSLGRAIIIDGDGQYKAYNKDFTKVTEQGEIKAGKKEGNWTGTDEELKITFTETYLNGNLQSGTSVDSTGHSVNYSETRNTAVNYKGGLSTFYKKLFDGIFGHGYHIDGNIIARFYVNNTGKIENFKFITPIDAHLEPIVRAAMAKCTDWVPATLYGRNIGVPYVIRLSFKTERRTEIRTSRLF